MYDIIQHSRIAATMMTNKRLPKLHMQLFLYYGPSFKSVHWFASLNAGIASLIMMIHMLSSMFVNHSYPSFTLLFVFVVFVITDEDDDEHDDDDDDNDDDDDDAFSSFFHIVNVLATLVLKTCKSLKEIYFKCKQLFPEVKVYQRFESKKLSAYSQKHF
uniref:Uncharacterized protein n=1 Tax=Glossina pallidipes TaxID=7398 RepID=A0A1B0AK47_GLOPL